MSYDYQPSPSRPSYDQPHATDGPPVDRSVKVPHLVFGLFLLGFAAIWALVAAEVMTADRLAVLGPAVLIGAGVIGLAASLANSRNRRRVQVSAPSENLEYDPYDDDAVSADQTDSTDHTQEIR